MKSLWQATIEEMFESGMTAQEIKDSLREMYPEIPELMAYVDDVMFKIGRVKGFIKKAQGFGFGYYNPGQTNYSVPNSEGSPGTGLGQLDPTNPSTPTSGYTDKAMMLNQQRKEEEEAKKRRELRKKLVEKMTDKKAAVPSKPGQALVVGPAGTKPGASIEQLTKNIDDKVKTIDRSLRTTEKEHEMAGQWTAEEQTAEESKVTTPTTPTAPKPGTTTTPTTPTKFIDYSYQGL